MKLLFISADFPPTRSAEADHAFHLALHLAQRGIDVRVLTSTARDVVSHPRLKVYPVMRRWSWTHLPRFASFVRQCAPDAVFLLFLGTMYEHHPMITFTPTITKMLFPSVPFVTQFENLVTWGQPNWSARLIRKLVACSITGEETDYTYGTLLRDSHQIIVLSDKHRVGLLAHSPKLDDKCVLIPPAPIMTMCPDDEGMTRARGRASLGIAPDEFVLVYYGYIYPGKGIETLLRALQQVVIRRPRIRLVMIGSFVEHTFSKEFALRSQSYEHQTKELTMGLGIADKVVWAGHCPSTEEQGSIYLHAADACVLPFDQGVYLNNSSFSAAATHGLAIVTTEGPILEPPIIHQKNVFLCPPKNPGAMAAAIETLIDNPVLRQHLCQGARELAAKWFSWSRVTARIAATFDRTAL